MNRLKNTPDPTLGDKPLVLNANEVFVFGANSLGIHAGGSAFAAQKFYGAILKEIHRTGRSYGLVTIKFTKEDDFAPERISQKELEEEFELFIKQTELENEKTFYLTKVGLGISGWDINDVVSAFKKCYNQKLHLNIVIPIEFEKCLISFNHK